MKTQSKIFAALFTLFAIVAITGWSLAYFTTQSTTKNRITASNVQVELLLTKADGRGGEQTASATGNILPGESESRIARGKNIGKEPFYVRAKVAETADDSLTLTGTDSTYWTYRDGYYYYSKALEPGEMTEPLFTGVTFPETADSSMAGREVKLDVEFQATQTAHNGDSALTARGWPED